MLSIPYLLGLSINLLGLLPSASPLLTYRSPPTNDPGYDLMVSKLAKGARAAQESIALKYPENPPNSVWLVVSYGLHQQASAPSGFALLHLTPYISLNDPQAFLLAQNPALPVACLRRAPLAGQVAQLVGAGVVVEGWVEDGRVVQRAAKRVNRLRYAAQGYTPGYIAYVRLMIELRKSPGFVPLDL